MNASQLLTASNIVAELRDAIPELASKLESLEAENDAALGPGWAAESAAVAVDLFRFEFAELLVRAAVTGPEGLASRYAGFIERMASSPDPLVRDWLGTGVFETIVGSASQAEFIRTRQVLGQDGQALFDRVAGGPLFRPRGGGD